MTDALLVLDGGVTPDESRAIATSVRAARRRGNRYIVMEHGGHRHHTGWGKSEFDPGWGEAEVVDFARAIVDHPVNAVAGPRGFRLYGAYRGVPGVVVVNTTGWHVWYIATVHPFGLP